MNITVCRRIVPIGDRRDLYRGLVGKPEGKRPLGKPWRRWDDNIKMDLQDVGVWKRSSWLRTGAIRYLVYGTLKTSEWTKITKVCINHFRYYVEPRPTV
jgi:hypothetical protein